MDRKVRDNSDVKNFNLMAVNLGLSRFGLSSFNLIIIWILLYETHSPFLSGLGDGILSLPLFFSFIVGALIDKSARKKTIAVWTSIGRAASLSTIFLGFYLNNVMLIVIAIYVSGFLIGFTSDILNSVRASWTKQLLSEERYKPGSSIMQTASSMAEGAGYVASGLLLALGFLRSFISIFIIFLISLGPILFMRVEESAESKTAMESIMEGLKFLTKSKAIVEAMIIIMLPNMILGMAGIMFTALVQIHFKLSPIYVSIVFFIFTLGIVIGSLLVQKVKGRVSVISMSSYAIMGVSIFSVSILKNIVLIFVPALIIGLLIGIITVVIDTATLKIVPQNLMARIQGAFSTLTLAMTFVSGMLGGLLIQFTSSTEAFMVIGLLLLILSPIWIMFRELSSIKI